MADKQPATRPRRALRQFNRRLSPCMYLASYASLEAVATDLQSRIRRGLYSRGTGTVIACDSVGGLYVLASRELRTDQFYADHFDWVVGVYADRGAGMQEQVPRVPELGDLLDDLQSHLADMATRTPLNVRPDAA